MCVLFMELVYVHTKFKHVTTHKLASLKGYSVVTVSPHMTSHTVVLL